MRQSVFSGLAVAGALCVLCSNCRSSEPTGIPRAAQRVRASQARRPAQRSAPVESDAPDSVLESLWPKVVWEGTATEHFMVLHQPRADYVAAAGETLEYAYRRFYDVFSQAGFDLSHATDRLVWICFPQKSDFSRYALKVEGMDLSWLDGYYSTLTNRVAIVQPDQKAGRPAEAVGPLGYGGSMAVAGHQSPDEAGGPPPPPAFGGPALSTSASTAQLDVTRLTHEVAHQLAFNSGIQKRGVMYPLWVSEGLATSFEFDGSFTAGLEHRNPPRCNGLLEAYAAGQLTPLRQFVVQATVPPDVQAGRRYYAQAWGFFHFLLTERPQNLRAYLARLTEGGAERRDAGTMLGEFTWAFGSPESLELAWRAFLTQEAQQALSDRWVPSAAGKTSTAQP
jgi:hypothetical protein